MKFASTSTTVHGPNPNLNLNRNLSPSRNSEIRNPKSETIPKSEIRQEFPFPRHQRAFTLIEVMIAVGIFFVALIAILGVMTRGLSAARGLQISGPDAGMLAAELYSTTNILQDSKTEDGDFGNHYPGFTWERESYLISSNGLFEVDFFIFKKSERGPILYDSLCIWLYKPDSPPAPVTRSPFGGGDFGRSER